MISKYKILTITHRQTRLSDIGNFILPETEGEALQLRLESLKAEFGLEELMYVSTCNRVMYFFFADQKLDARFTKGFFHSINPELSVADIEKKVCALEGEKALEHVFKVGASIDSLVVGEREILRQLREAYDRCENWNLIGHNLRLAFQTAVQAAKEVYAQTKIGEKPVSVVSLAIQKLLESQLPKKARILMVGAGQTNTLFAKFLRKHGYDNVRVYNRSIEKAENVANMLGGEAALLADLPEYKEGFDCLVVCTGSSKAIITPELYEQLLQGDLSRKLVIDLSIPYNVDKEVVEKFAVNYIEIEGLKALAGENLAFREKEVTIAMEMIEAQISNFQVLYQQRRITRALKQVPAEIKAVKEKALQEVFKKEIENLDDETQELLHKMMTYMEKKCIGIPMKAAKQAVI